MSFPSVNRANKYARDVVAGKIVACKWIVLACQRHLDDLRTNNKKTSKYVFDKPAAERVCKFIQNMPHTKGKWAREGATIDTEMWQCFFVCCIFGWKVRATGLRKYRTAVLIVPRKNGKSALAAAIGLYMLSADDEYGAEIYSGATTEKQAWEVFRPAKIMAEKCEDYRDMYGVTVNASNICQESDGSRFEPLIGNPGDGSSPSLSIVDEYHEHKTDALYDTMQTGMGAREQGLMLVITTAGDNVSGPCYQLQTTLQRVLEGIIEDETLFGMIYTIDREDQDKWDTEDALIKANPNYGISISDDFLKNRLNDALNTSRKQAIYKTKHLNIWVGAREAYFNLQRWNESADKSLKMQQFKEYKCYLSMDLASKIDIAALSIIFKIADNDFVRFGKYYLPEKTINQPQNEHYQEWNNDGWLTETEGEMIDYEVIFDDIVDLCTRFDVEELSYDPFQATMLVTKLMGQGVPVIEIPATVKNFSDPMKHVDGLIRSRRIRHNGDPVYTWMLSNVVAKEDAKENVFPRKAADRDENKIDGVVADIMAFNRIMAEDVNNISDAIDNMLSVKL
jgi:phage terminase large subunit-like protein